MSRVAGGEEPDQLITSTFQDCCAVLFRSPLGNQEVSLCDILRSRFGNPLRRHLVSHEQHDLSSNSGP
jgi:hypothetical protein